MEKKRRGRPRKAESWNAQLLQERSREYFDKCDGRTKVVQSKEGPVEVPWPEPYSIEGLCVYLDVPRWQFQKWRKQTDTLGKKAEMVHLRVMANRVCGALDGTQNSTFAQFMLKNNDAENYKEKVEVESSVSEQVAGLLERSLATWECR